MNLIDLFVSHGFARFLAEESRFSGLHGGDGLSRWVIPLRGGLHDFCGACGASSFAAAPGGGEGLGEGWHLVLHTIFHELQLVESRSPLGHPKNRTLHPVQLRFLG